MPRSLARPATTPIFPDELAAGGDQTVREIAAPRAAVHDISTPHPAFARGSRPAITATTEPASVTPSVGRSAGEIVARILYFASGALIAVAVVLYGGRLWHAPQDRPPPSAAALPPGPAMAVVAANGRIELAADHRGVTRIAGTGPHWTAALPAALDAIEVTGPLVLGRAPDALIALDLDSGR
ncbi:MAG: hypothetical protein E6J90_36520, partial [Deltaproteobacteria bacterium]